MRRKRRLLICWNWNRTVFLVDSAQKPDWFLKLLKYEGWESLGVAGQTLGHYLSACAMYYATSGDERFLQRLEYTINELDSCQQANGDGYLAATPDGKRIFKEVSAGKIYSQGFDLNGGWVPLYVMHKVLAGLIDTYQYAHNERALAVAEKLAIGCMVPFSILQKNKCRKCWHVSLVA